MTQPTWVTIARSCDLGGVARALGLEVRDARGPTAGEIGPCPACRAETRHPGRGDRRLAIGMRGDRAGWRCHQCDASGDAIDLVAHVLCGARYRMLGEEHRPTVRAWFEDGHYRGRRSNSGGWYGETLVMPPPSALTYWPRYPAVSDLEKFWTSCVPVTDDDEVASFLQTRGLAAVAVATRGLARALPSGSFPPSWATFGHRSWTMTGHRLIVPMYDADGDLRSVRARLVVDVDAPKSLPPSGHACAGLVMADAAARDLLRAGRDAPADRDTVYVTEGETDFLVAAANVHTTSAVFGIVSGSWTSQLAARVPDGVHVVIATDADDAGERYASKIVDSFRGRANVRLGRWEAGHE